MERSVKSAATLVSTWRSLVLEFNQIMLARKRREDPDNKSQWNLKAYEGLHVDVRAGPIFEVIKVSYLGPLRDT